MYSREKFTDTCTNGMVWKQLIKKMSLLEIYRFEL